MKTLIFDTSYRVLVYREGNLWFAHALELDVVADGQDEESAVQALQDTVCSHISYAAHKGADDSLLFPAPKEYFERWEVANRNHLKGGDHEHGYGEVHAKVLVCSGKPSGSPSTSRKQFSELEFA